MKNYLISEGPDKIWNFLQDKNNINTFICTAGSFLFIY